MYYRNACCINIRVCYNCLCGAVVVRETGIPVYTAVYCLYDVDSSPVKYNSYVYNSYLGI